MSQGEFLVVLLDAVHYNVYRASLYKLLCDITNSLGSDQAVQSQKMYGGWNFGFRKKRYCTIRVAKTKALISFAVTAKLICAFVFAYADCWFPVHWRICHIVNHLDKK